mgnify:FL=1
MKPLKVLKESDIEREVCLYAKHNEMGAYKFTSPMRAAVPDRILLSEIPEHLRDVIARYIRFIEFKRPGEKPTAAQTREHLRLRAMGFTVEVIDDIAEGECVVDEMLLERGNHVNILTN